MIYIDPPYGIKYGSNFQPFVNKRDMKDGKDEDLTAEPEQIKAFRDTWELGIHSYLTYLRDRLLLARELLTESGSIFVQISDENVHHVRELMDEVFGAGNFCSVVSFVKTGGKGSALLDTVGDFLVWYAKDKTQVKFRQLYYPKLFGGEKTASYVWICSPDGNQRRRLSAAELEERQIPQGWRLFSAQNLTSQSGGDTLRFPVKCEGRIFVPTKNFWKTNVDGMDNVLKTNRLIVAGNSLNYVRYQDDFPVIPINNIWTDTAIAGFSGEDKVFVVQTAKKVIQRCLLITTDPGDLVFDPTCVRKGTKVWVCSPAPVLGPSAGLSPSPALSPSPVLSPSAGVSPSPALCPSPALPARGEGDGTSPRVRGDERGAAFSRVRGETGASGSPPVVPPYTGGQEGAAPYTGGQEGAAPYTGGQKTPSPRAGRAGEGLATAPIETLQPGAYVLGHDGLPHRVLRVIRRGYKGTMIGIRHALCDQTLWLTADHKVLAHRRPHRLGGNADWSGIPKPLRGRSKELRKNMTPPERKLWNVLRGSTTGYTFRRQHPIGRYIADFYCREAALVVEVDGAIAHGHPAAYEHDRMRDEFMHALSLRVLRFSAADVEHNLEGVHAAIEEACQDQRAPEHAQWIEAGRIARGDIVFYGPNRTPVRVEEVRREPSEEEVYDLEVEGAHSFLSEVCAVHNCGSGTTAYVAEQWGRRWMTCDTSRVALALARQRLMTAVFDYYELAHPEEGVGSGFKYKTVPHVTLKSIANNLEIDGIYARMHPAIEKALADLNAALKALTPGPSPTGRGEYPRFKVAAGGREGQLVDFAAPDDATFTMPSGQAVRVNELVEWEVPFEFPADWPEAARKAFEGFHAARRAMQQKMDEAIARHADQETLYDQPLVDRKKARISGPFTVEAVPAPAVKSPEEILEAQPQPADASIARSGETLRQAEWRDELLRTGIRGKAGQYIRFSRLEPLPYCRWLHAEGETKPSAEGADTVCEEAPAYNPMRVVVSFGPEHAPLEQRQVERAWEEARQLVPKPKLLVFAGFQFDPEAAKDIDEMKLELAGMQFLKVQMNADLLTDDLKKKRASNESFWLIGQPEVEVRRDKEGKYIVSVHGFDYYNTKTGQLESGGQDKIALWMLDTDYDGRSLYPRQVFFPLAGDDEGWAKLARNLKAEIDPERIRAYWGTVSLPFEAGEYKRIAVKIVDDRGIESLKVVEVD